MTDKREKRVELILQQLDELPTLPAIALQVMKATGADDSDARQVTELIAADPALTARILKLAGRADLGVGAVGTIDRAVALLGFDAIRSAVLAVSVFQSFGEGDPRAGGHFCRRAFWKHSIAVACCAELLAESLMEEQGRPAAGVEPAEAFVCGLLHDLGKVALDAMLPKSFDRVVEAVDLLRGNIADLERTVIGLDHLVVGKRLAERWQLPTSIRDCAWLHGQQPAALPAGVRNPRLVNLISLADVIARERHLGFSGNHTFPVPKSAWISAVGLTPERIDAAMVGLVDRIEPRADALGLAAESTNELYLQALSQANRELGRVSGQLATKNKKLAVRAKFFDALSGFQSVLRPDAPPQTVLEAIGRTAINVLDVRGVCAFSLQPGAPYAEAMVLDDGATTARSVLIDAPATEASEIDETAADPSGAPTRDPRRPPMPAPAPGEGPILNAAEDLEWLLADISPRLPGQQRHWICLTADDICIGGVVWGNPPGEAHRLGPQAQELSAMAGGWSLALRTAQIRDEARALSEQLADANRRLHDAHSQILRGKTLKTIGEVAAGAAHEMNNPLMVISGRSQLLASQLSDPKQAAAAKQIFEQSHRLSGMITELMDFAKPQPPLPAPVSMGGLLEIALAQAKARCQGADRTVEASVESAPAVHVDRQQIADALAEILANAIQATAAHTGRLSIHAALDPYSQCVVVTIVDNGCGMDDHALKHAMDPFFSSRKAGRGRGMGLAKAARWVESNGGSIRLESRPDEGTRVMMLLPAAGAGEATGSPDQAMRKTAP